MATLRFIFITYLSLAVSDRLFSQQGNVWYFGKNAGVNFNTNPPSALTDGQIYTLEGCSSISDMNGNLLFYTDGSFVFNKNHQVMANGSGLRGSYSTTQAALIVQKPGSDSLFYVFTANSQAENLNIGYNYSVIDMSLNLGLGDVIQKNIFLYGPCTERLTAVRHANGVDVWIITNEFQTNNFKVYLLDCNGFNPNPVVSSVGLVLAVEDVRASGCVKVSPDNSLLAYTIVEPSVIDFFKCFQLFSFDNATGIISNPIIIPTPGSTYGAEFSPDGRLLYVGSAKGFPEAREIFQYNITVLDSTAIVNSIYTIPTTSRSNTFLQIGPDNKIYKARHEETYLAAINNPNVQGAGCNYEEDAISLSSRECQIGLPSFFGAYLRNNSASINYTASADCSSISFNGSTLITGPVNWYWDFGDGSFSTQQNPVHSFANGNNSFIVKLTVTPLNGCGKAIASTSINLTRPIILPQFSSNVSCGNLTVDFTNQSTISTGNISSWQWDFGDGTLSTLQNPTHIFAGPGNYAVKLVAYYNQGCIVKDSVTKLIGIETKPLALFTNSNACANSPIQFTDGSTIATGSITGWSWIFGDGNSSTQQNPNHNYSIPGNYTVKLLVRSATGCISDTISKPLTVESKPVAVFQTGTSCVDSLVRFTDLSSIQSGAINQWSWEFGDGAMSNQQNGLHLYLNPGIFKVRLSVRSSQLCKSDTVEKIITVDAKPIAGFRMDDGCEGSTISPINSSQISTGTINGFHWNFGNGTSASQSQPAIVYNSSGNFQVKLAVSSSNGCISDTFSTTVRISPLPLAQFSNSAACLGNNIQFIDESRIPSGTINSYSWNFGDGTTKQTKDPTHIFRQEGVYPVSLTVLSAEGCEDRFNKTLQIKSIKAFAGNDTIAIKGQPIQLRGSGGSQYQWTPPLYLNNPNIQTPVAILDNDQTYTLKVTSSEGCIALDEINIKVVKEPGIYVPNAFAPNGKNRFFRPILVGVKELYYFNIYNRWGQLVFSTNEIGKGWDGRINGVLQGAGTYVWSLKVKNHIGVVIQQNGNIILVP